MRDYIISRADNGFVVSSHNIDGKHEEHEEKVAKTEDEAIDLMRAMMNKKSKKNESYKDVEKATTVRMLKNSK